MYILQEMLWIFFYSINYAHIYACKLFRIDNVISKKKHSGR